MKTDPRNKRLARFLAAGVASVAMTFAGWTAHAAETATRSDARTQLQRFVSDVRSASGTFTQQVTDAQGQQRAPQSGEFSFRRPGQFRWHTQKPYEQLVISDGKVLRQYDPDLAQVTERPVDQSIGASPAAILFGSGSLEESFELSSLPPRDDLLWLRARPRGGDAGFAHVDIGFAEGMPRRLELLDAFGQTTRIGLADISANPVLPADAFTFEAPPDVDVVKMP